MKEYLDKKGDSAITDEMLKEKYKADYEEIGIVKVTQVTVSIANQLVSFFLIMIMVVTF
jgi:hypothetical protein